ncbi:hypothetical protein [Methylobacterium nodulans]|uniref:Uncharacterized protein n=1 Tax=Methylobacterium nodulans (strain LMG 21967 / CNCM I-2342 / ORS 2060) TaxID=460265 RepID=B8IPN4_METNO|nr:hypothetical protein [Methylobacterium nodulans]ACL62326.1 hypothetical protein Mnod_7590 [Methylobacterium nodulans ORS 2060]
MAEFDYNAFHTWSQEPDLKALDFRALADRHDQIACWQIEVRAAFPLIEKAVPEGVFWHWLCHRCDEIEDMRRAVVAELAQCEPRDAAEWVELWAILAYDHGRRAYYGDLVDPAE